MFRLPRLDITSFWLGFIAATLFWFLFSRIRPLFPKILAWYKNYARELKLRSQEGVNESLRRETIRRVQRAHLASSMFMLDEIILTPKVIAPPPEFAIGADPITQSTIEQALPYLPDWPELASSYGVPTFTLAEALQNGSRIAVIGRPGSGKTIALAHLASLVARNDPSIGSLSNRVPFYFHILDLDITLTPEKPDPLENLLKLFSSRVSVIVQNQLPRFIQDQFAEGGAILIIDGLDELPSTTLPPITAYLTALSQKYPKIQWVVSAHIDTFDGLGKLGFVPLALAAWNDRQRTEFLDRWAQNWTSHITPEIIHQTSTQPISPILINNWLRGEKGSWSPMEWTLKVWGAYSGDLKAISPIGGMDTYLSRFVAGPVTRSALETLAREFIIQNQASLPYNHLEKLLTSRAPQPAGIEHIAVDETKKSGKNPAKKGGDLISSAGELVLIALSNQGLIIEHPNSMISILNPAFLGYLAATSLAAEDIQIALTNHTWVSSQQALRYASAQNQDTGWIDSFLQRDDLPLYSRLLTIARWLPDSSPNLPWRSNVLRGLANLLQENSLPLSLRAKFIAAFTILNDASVTKLFQQLMGSTSPQIRQLSALGAGVLGDPGLVNNLMDLLSDLELTVRCAACHALTAIRNDQALSVVAGALMQGDEGLRQAAAEALIHIPNIGPETIREAAHVDDLLTRRAAVFGLMQLREPWSADLLEKMASEDGQWVVRNASAHALDELRSPNPRIPKPLPPAWDSPWLIEFAAKRGQGILPEQMPVDTLMAALVSGTNEDQMMALNYLKDQPDEKVVVALYKLFYGDQPEMQEIAFRTLQHFTACGFDLPSPHKYGYG
jgi:hypothetical protein